VPEGDVVLRTARRLHAAFAGAPLTVTDLRWPSLATVDLTGREVLEVVAVGKHLLARFTGGLTLHSHLRMDGSWRLTRTAPGAAGRPFRPGDHRIRAVLPGTGWACSTWCRPTPRTAWSVTSVRTSSPPAGTRRR
jgi:endonuclease-8